MSKEERVSGPGLGTDIIPLRQALEVAEEAEEVLDGEVVDEGSGSRDGSRDMRWKQWWDVDRYTTNFKLEVDDTWYRRASREDWEELNRLAVGLVELQRRTTR